MAPWSAILLRSLPFKLLSLHSSPAFFIPKLPELLGQDLGLLYFNFRVGVNPIALWSFLGNTRLLQGKWPLSRLEKLNGLGTRLATAMVSAVPVVYSIGGTDWPLPSTEVFVFACVYMQLHAPSSGNCSCWKWRTSSTCWRSQSIPLNSSWSTSGCWRGTTLICSSSLPSHPSSSHSQVKI